MKVVKKVDAAVVKKSGLQPKVAEVLGPVCVQMCEWTDDVITKDELEAFIPLIAGEAKKAAEKKLEGLQIDEV